MVKVEAPHNPIITVINYPVAITRWHLCRYAPFPSLLILFDGVLMPPY